MNNFLEYFIGIASVVVSIYIAKKKLSVGYKREIATQQLQNVYLPLFKLLEPSLYKAPNIELIENFLITYDSIASSHYELIDPNLIDVVRLLRKNIDEENFYNEYESLCACIERNFEENRKALLLPTRKISYKLNNDQFPKETRQVISQIGNSLSYPLFLLFSLAITTLAVKFILNVLKTVFTKI